MLHRVRYWDGSTWTDSVADGASAITDLVCVRHFLCETLVFIGPPFLAFWVFLTFAALAGGALQWSRAAVSAVDNP